jgi:hypothetical protein
MDVDQEIRQYMAWAIRGALEKLFTDIANARTGDGIPDFEGPEIMGLIGSTVTDMIWTGLSTPDVPEEIGMDGVFIEALLSVTGEQVMRPGGIDFNEYLNIGQMKLLKEKTNGAQWIVGILGFIGHAIVEGTR